MMPAYSQSRVSCLFFIAFVVFGVFFLANYLLAVVYDAYTTTERAHQQEKLAQRSASLAAAFDLLDWEGRGTLTRERISLVLDQLPRAEGYAGVGGGPGSAAAAAAAPLCREL
eukprot:1695099-Prymnesium_polylepis.3